MNATVEERLHDYGFRLDDATAAYGARVDARALPESPRAPTVSIAPPRRRAAALVGGLATIAIVVGAVAVATHRTAARPPAQTVAATTTTTVGLHTINGETFGPMPNFGPGAVTMADDARIPDYVSVAERDGRGIAGYVKKTDLHPVVNGQMLPGGPVLPVYADGGSPLVGHFYECKGFVALSEDPTQVASRCPPPVVVTAPSTTLTR